MLKFLLSATLVASVSTAGLSAATFVERLPTVEVEMKQLRTNPDAYLNTRVRFRAVYIGTPGIYDPIHTPYSAERYLNIAVWDDEDLLYDPEVRARPLVTLYADKRIATKREVIVPAKYQLVEVIGDVSSNARGLPWINIHSVVQIEDSKAYNDNAIYQVEQGRILAADGAYELADTRYAAAIADDLPPTAEVAIRELRARNAMEATKFADAAKSLREALVIAKASSKTGEKHATKQGIANLHYLLAKTLGEVADEASGAERTKAFEEAITNAREGLDIDPTNGDAYAVLGISLAGLGRFDEARRECAQAIRLQPNNAEVRWYLGRILDSQGEHDQAIEALKKAIDLTPKDFRIHKAIAAAYFHRAEAGSTSAPEDYSTAIREYDITLRLRPDDVDSAYESGSVIAAAAKAKAEITINGERTIATVDHAEARFLAALAIDQQHIPSMEALAILYQDNNRTDDAIRVINDLLAIQPDRIQTVLLLAQLQVSNKAYDDALATVEAYRVKHPNDPTILANIGRLALTIERPEAGISALETLTKADSKNAAAQLDLAECYIATDRYDDAISRLKTASRYANEEMAPKVDAAMKRAETAKQDAKNQSSRAKSDKAAAAKQAEKDKAAADKAAAEKSKAAAADKAAADKK